MKKIEVWIKTEISKAKGTTKKGKGK